MPSNYGIYRIGIISMILFIQSCTPCNEDAAIQEWKDIAWGNLGGADTIWFPPESEMNITSKGPITGEYTCDFVAYGKRNGEYRAFKVNMGLKCTPQGMVGIDYAANLTNSYGWDVTDSMEIRGLEQTPPSQFTHKKKSWEKD